MKTLLITFLLTTSFAYAAESDCFLDYNSVCGKSADGTVELYLNQCHLEVQSATAVAEKNCQSSESRGPASVNDTVYGEIKFIEGEIDTLLKNDLES